MGEWKKIGRNLWRREGTHLFRADVQFWESRGTWCAEVIDQIRGMTARRRYPELSDAKAWCDDWLAVLEAAHENPRKVREALALVEALSQIEAEHTDQHGHPGSDEPLDIVEAVGEVSDMLKERAARIAAEGRGDGA